MGRTAVFPTSMVVVLAVSAIGGTSRNFVPDWTFTGSTLANWQIVGEADWRAENGEIIGTPKSPDGGWLLLDKSFQDVQFSASFRCTGGCQTGVMVRAEKTADGMKGVYFAAVDSDAGSYAVKLDAQGKQAGRERLRPGGGQMRIAPPASGPGPIAAPGRQGGRGAAAGGRGRGTLASGVSLPIQPASTALRPNDWNEIEVIIDANIIRPYINDGGTSSGVAEEEAGRFGPMALYVGGTGEVRFKNLAYKDLSIKTFPKEAFSVNFTPQRLSEFYYSWSAAAADVNRDGHIDIISGPFAYLGPSYTSAREIYLGQTFSPSNQYPKTMVAFAEDFTGDGWPDLLTGFNGPTTLYVNPKGEPRRWDTFVVLPNVTSEISVVRDINGDGKPEYIFAADGAINWARPDPANPTGQWVSHVISESGTANAHGLGAGDINGDGRLDIVNVYGWWEQPSTLALPEPWTYHPVAFGRSGGHAGAGGAEMAVFDLNGDKLADVVTSLQAHGFGLAWFEQKRDRNGTISFVQHMVMDDFTTKNAGNVTFSELHGSTSGDVNGDGIPDFIVGKRHWAHEESYTDPDPNGPGVLYVYRTVRNPKAPGGAELVPELIHNRSGAGSQVLARDLNRDGVLDIVTSTTRGAYVFWGKRVRRATTPPAPALPALERGK